MHDLEEVVHGLFWQRYEGSTGVWQHHGIIKLKLIAASAAAMASGSWNLTKICQIINYKGDKNANLRSGGVCRS